MGKKRIRRKIYPELYVHLKLNKNLSEGAKSVIKEKLSRASEKAFWEVFGKPAWGTSHDRAFSIEDTLGRSGKLAYYSLRDQTPEVYEMAVILEDGSIKVKILSGLTFLYFAIGSWGSFVSGSNDIASRLRWAYDNLLPEVQDIIGQENIQDKIRHERRIGAVVRLDELIQQYQDQRIQREELLEEGNTILHKIAQSEDSDVLVPLVSHYFEQQYNFEINNLYSPDNHPQIPLDWPDDEHEHQIPVFGALLPPLNENEDN